MILQKFDVEIGDERTNELKELRTELNQQAEEFSCWQKTVCDPQIKLYVMLNERQYCVNVSFILDFIFFKLIITDTNSWCSRRKKLRDWNLKALCLSSWWIGRLKFSRSKKKKPLFKYYYGTEEMIICLITDIGETW